MGFLRFWVESVWLPSHFMYHREVDQNAAGRPLTGFIDDIIITPILASIRGPCYWSLVGVWFKVRVSVGASLTRHITHSHHKICSWDQETVRTQCHSEWITFVPSLNHCVELVFSCLFSFLHIEIFGENNLCIPDSLPSTGSNFLLSRFIETLCAFPLRTYIMHVVVCSESVMAQ